MSVYLHRQLSKYVSKNIYECVYEHLHTKENYKNTYLHIMIKFRKILSQFACIYLCILCSVSDISICDLRKKSP